MLRIILPKQVLNAIQNNDYSVEYEERLDFLRATVKGECATLEIARSYWLDIAHRVLESGHKKLLVVEDIPEAIAISEVHQLVTDLAQLPVRDIRVAFVDLFSQHKSLNEFGILVAENRGLNLRIFDSEELATEWLNLAT